MATWQHTKINIDGRTVKAQAPIIISASRSTDIPAFYADWFFDRLKKGYSAWTNPFNDVKSYVSYDKTRFIVFWSKSPRPLLDYLHILEERNIKCYIQYTLNDYSNKAQSHEISKIYRFQWVESRGVLTIIALVLFLFSAICWGFTAQHQVQESIAYRNIFRVARAYHGASSNDLQYLRNVFLEQGHDKERTQLLRHSDQYEVRWNAVQDSLIRVREEKKIQ